MSCDAAAVLTEIVNLKTPFYTTTWITYQICKDNIILKTQRKRVYCIVLAQNVRGFSSD